jgi:hypothetical protein
VPTKRKGYGLWRIAAIVTLYQQITERPHL